MLLLCLHMLRRQMLLVLPLGMITVVHFTTRGQTQLLGYEVRPDRGYAIGTPRTPGGHPLGADTATLLRLTNRHARGWMLRYLVIRFVTVHSIDTRISGRLSIV